MKKYEVTLYYHAVYSMVVEAENEEEKYFQKPKYFSAMVILSGYYNEHRQKIKDIALF